MPTRHRALDFLSALLLGQTQPIERLQIHPEIRKSAKPLAEVQGHISGKKLAGVDRIACYYHTSRGIIISREALSAR